MTFQVEISEKADNDLRNIFLCIAIDLFSPEVAEKQIHRLWKEMLSLNKFPERYRLYEDEPWHSRGMRTLPVDNYVILYIPDSEERIVRIVRILYSGRDIGEQLADL